MTDEKILYMLFSLEAKLRIQQDLLIEIADIITDKTPDEIRNEIAIKTIMELKKVKRRSKCTTSIITLDFIASKTGLRNLKLRASLKPLWAV